MIPVDFTFHPSWWNKNAGVDFDEKFFNDAEYRIEADIHMRKVLFDKFGDLGFGEYKPQPRPILDSDLIAGEYIQSAIMGCDILFSKSNLPYVVCKNAQSDEIMQLSEIDINNNKYWISLVRQAEYLKHRYGYVYSFVDLHGVQNLALDVRGQLLFEDYYFDKELAHRLLGICTGIIDYTARFLKGISDSIGIGVTSIIRHVDPGLYVTSNCTVEMISNRLYEEFLLKHDSYLSSRYQPFGIHHCGKTLEHVLDGYSKVPGVSFIEAGAFSNLELVRKNYPKTFINARFSPQRLKEDSPEEIKNKVKNMARKAKPFNLLSFSCVGIDSETCDDNIRAFVKAVRDITC